MNRRTNQRAALFALAALLAVQPCSGQCADLIRSSVMAIATGKLQVTWKSAVPKRVDHVMIHFHGANETVQAAIQRSNLDAVLVIVNFPGLSSAYSQPFAKDHELFEQILARAKNVVQEHSGSKLPWKRVTLSSFSAGYGAVREILKTPKYFERIDDIVAADSIYAGLQANQLNRQVDVRNMQHFLRFARLATDGRKSFTISHSSQSTPYASTTETADYLLRALQLDRKPNTTIHTRELRQRTLAKRGQFSVLGFDGTTGKEHMLHLHHIDLMWNLLPIDNASQDDLRKK